MDSENSLRIALSEKEQEAKEALIHEDLMLGNEYYQSYIQEFGPKISPSHSKFQYRKLFQAPPKRIKTFSGGDEDKRKINVDSRPRIVKYSNSKSQQSEKSIKVKQPTKPRMNLMKRNELDKEKKKESRQQKPQFFKFTKSKEMLKPKKDVIKMFLERKDFFSKKVNQIFQDRIKLKDFNPIKLSDLSRTQTRDYVRKSRKTCSFFETEMLDIKTINSKVPLQESEFGCKKNSESGIMRALSIEKLGEKQKKPHCLLYNSENIVKYEKPYRDDSTLKLFKWLRSSSKGSRKAGYFLKTHLSPDISFNKKAMRLQRAGNRVNTSVSHMKNFHKQIVQSNQEQGSKIIEKRLINLTQKKDFMWKNQKDERRKAELGRAQLGTTWFCTG